MIKPTGFPPLPHSHTMSQITDLGPALDGEFNAIRNAQAGSSARNYAPFCRVVFNGTFNVGNATDTYMGGGMQTLHDNASMVYLAGNQGGGGDTTKFRVVIPMNGFYRVSWKYYMDGLGASAPSAFVTLNNVQSVVTGSIINSQGAANGWASAHATDVVYLTTNDRLYFGLWQGSGGTRTFYGTWFGGSRSQVWVEWVGR